MQRISDGEEVMLVEKVQNQETDLKEELMSCELKT